MINLSERSKKIAFFVFFVAFTVGTGYALYYFFFKPSTPVTVVQGENEQYTGEFGASGERGPDMAASSGEQGALPEAGIAEGGATETVEMTTGVEILRDAVTQAVSMSPGGETRFYDPETGRFYRISPTGAQTSLTDSQFYNVKKVDWSKKGDQAILEFPDDSKVYYDFEKDRQYSLPSHWEDFVFSPNDNTVVAKSMGLDQNNRFLITSSADGNETTALYHLGDNASLVLPSWSPNNQIIGFSKTGSPQPDGAEQILLLGKNHENFKSLVVPGYGFQPNWSPSGKKLLYSVYHTRDDNKPMLWVSDASGDNIGTNRKKLNLNTWADKCVWGNENSLYCAVPVNLPAGAGYDEQSFNAITSDIYKIDLTTGVAKKVSTPDQSLPVINPILSKGGDKLIFTDGGTGKLYSYDLAE